MFDIHDLGDIEELSKVIFWEYVLHVFYYRTCYMQVSNAQGSKLIVASSKFAT